MSDSEASSSEEEQVVAMETNQPGDSDDSDDNEEVADEAKDDAADDDDSDDDDDDDDDEDATVKGETEYDLGNLACFSYDSVDNHQFSQNPSKFLNSLARDSTQELMNRIFKLPTEASSDMVGRLATLPEPNTHLPRAKPVPKPKEPTKWEAFAKTKGIIKKKKSKMVYDEDKEKYMPRFGYKKADDETTAWAIAHKEGEDPSIDPWTKMAAEKKERVEKNKKAQLKNLQRASGNRLPGTIDLTTAMKGKTHKRKAMEKEIEKEEKAGGTGHLVQQRGHVDAAFNLAAVSTASMGAFDQLRGGEVAKLKKVGKKARKKLGAASAPAGPSNKHLAASLSRNHSKEKQQSLSVLNRVMGGVHGDRGDFNSTKEVNAAAQLKPRSEEEKAARGKAKAKASSKKGKFGKSKKGNKGKRK